MDDLTDTTQGQEAPAGAGDTGGNQETAPAGTQEQQAGSGGNPAWAPLKEKLGLNFGLVENDLKEMDRAAQARIESVNKQYEPFKALVDQGYTLTDIQRSLQIAQEIEADPLAFNTKYQEYLRVTGRMPETPGEVLQAEELADDAENGETPTDLSNDPALQQLRQEQANMRAWVEQQQREQLVSQESIKLDAETVAFKAAHPELAEEDVKDIIRQAAAIAVTTGKVPSLEEAGQSFIATRNRILSQPRAGDSAPRLLPTSGGVPAADGQRKSLGELSSDETADLFAGLISKK